MATVSNSRKAFLLLVACAIGLPACTTTQLQKQYPSFDGCFREQKMISSVAGGLAGALLGAAVGGKGKEGTALAIGGAALGAMIGQKIAWESCLKAFPPRSETTLVAPVPAQRSGAASVPAAAKSLNIRMLDAKPLVFGRDLDVTAQFTFVSDKPDARDIKARVSRNLLFVTPDGKRQEIASSSEDTIQQGTSRTTFAIPTPSAQDAKELLQTSDWAVKFVVEADGQRTEQIVPLQVPELAQTAVQTAVKATASSDATPKGSTTQLTPAAVPSAPITPAGERISLRVGTRLLSSPETGRVITTTTKPESARVLQRQEVRKKPWIEVELANGVKGWITGEAK